MTAKSTSISESVRIADGSSRMSTEASPASALAIETCCCWAIERLPTTSVAMRVVEPDGVEQRVHGVGLGRPVDPDAFLQFAPDEDVLGDAELREELRLLVDGLHAEGDGIRGRRDRHRLAVELRSAGVGALGPGHDLDEGGLAGAVLADERVHGPGCDAHVGVADGADTAVVLDDSGERHARHGAHGFGYVRHGFLTASETEGGTGGVLRAEPLRRSSSDSVVEVVDVLGR